MFKVCWESTLVFLLVVEILFFKKLCNGFGLNLNLESGIKVDFFRGRELSQEYNRKTINISMSKFVQEMEPVAVPKHVKDDLDVLLEANVHSESCRVGPRLPTVMIF